MLASISPLGERARGNRWGRTAAAYTVASIAAAGALGLVLGALGGLLELPGLVLSVVAVGAGIADLGGWVPSTSRQVNEQWLDRYRGWVYGAGFGGQLGLGVVTVVTTATVYAWMVGAALTRSAVAGMLIGALFGLARALPLGVVASVDDAADLRGRLRRLTRAAGPARVATAVAAIAVGVAVGVTA